MDKEFRHNCELRAMDKLVSTQHAFEALDHIVKNPRRDCEDQRTLNQAIFVLESFIASVDQRVATIAAEVVYKAIFEAAKETP